MTTPYTRRDFAKFALAAIPAAGLLSAPSALRAATGKPNSKVNGVMIGLNVPYSFGGRTMPGDEILKNCRELNVSGLELRMQPVEAFLGLPAIVGATKAGTPKAAKTGDAPDNNTMKLREWRRTAPLARVADFRRMFDNGGVAIEILKVDGIFAMTPEELDYSFTIAKTLGARAISTEISKKEEDHQRVGQFADKHRILLALHGHATTTGADYERAYAHGKFVGSNLDIGHYVAGDNGSPVDFIKKNHARISHVHIKDRKKGNGPNTPFGEGDTPIKDVLRLIRDNKWAIQATIEFEYKVPESSTRMAEIARAVKYCRDALA
ncbi:MAG: sugar phosphate isomerase/epimerase [Opitutaceae bacterium]|nr:sugar phosphate isomerase/epimerase [Opitutaceae bacterium]